MMKADYHEAIYHNNYVDPYDVNKNRKRAFLLLIGETEYHGPSPYNFPQTVVLHINNVFIKFCVHLGFMEKVDLYLKKSESIKICAIIAVKSDDDINIICSVIWKGHDGVDHISISMEKSEPKDCHV